MNLPMLRFFNPDSETSRSRNHLPHWQQLGAVYFVTFHLGDSIPAFLYASWKVERDAWMSHHPKPWSDEVEQEYHRRFSALKERWLDAGHGSCLLRNSLCRKAMEQSLRHFEGRRCHQLAWVVMPNHVHVLFVLNPAWGLEQIIHSWKRHSARQINRIVGRSGSLWQKDYYDRLVRDPDHLGNCVRYIRRNPLKARLRPEQYTLWENDLVREMG